METPAIRLHHAFKHLITPRALIIRPHVENESVIKPQERSRTRVLSNTSRQKHLLLSVFSSKVLTFFSLSCLNCLWTITGKETNKADFSRRDSCKIVLKNKFYCYPTTDYD